MLDQVEKLQRHHDERSCTAVQRAVTGASRKGMPSLDKKSAPKLYTDVEALNGTPTTNGLTPDERPSAFDGKWGCAVYGGEWTAQERNLQGGSVLVEADRRAAEDCRGIYATSFSPKPKQRRSTAKTAEAILIPHDLKAHLHDTRRAEKGNIPISTKLSQALRPLTTSVI
ncbi:hypothetical protein LTR56_024311 [Elasticomyces elasticus]|nr:hypothetical protein LTR56_024311 [Elasticomyces elasticus]KAK4908191.1 hypothetical protein LTR49_022877 [Elasticomyces elasticus]